jgi:hypothetical protein
MRWRDIQVMGNFVDRFLAGSMHPRDAVAGVCPSSAFADRHRLTQADLADMERRLVTSICAGVM